MVTTNVQHTPGPWVADGAVVEHFDAPAKEDIAVCARGYISTLPSDGDEARANARLIAAAPDLLAALDDLTPLLDSLLSLATPLDPPDIERISQARVAIKKARGE